MSANACFCIRESIKVLIMCEKVVVRFFNFLTLCTPTLIKVFVCFCVMFGGNLDDGCYEDIEQQSILKFRPLTTGDVNLKNVAPAKLSKRSEATTVGSILSTTLNRQQQPRLRPRAPRSRISHHDAENDHTNNKTSDTDTNLSRLKNEELPLFESSNRPNSYNNDDDVINSKNHDQILLPSSFNESCRRNRNIGAPSLMKTNQAASKNITEKWGYLNHFSVSNLGRMLPSDSGDIHYLNLVEHSISDKSEYRNSQ